MSMKLSFSVITRRFSPTPELGRTFRMLRPNIPVAAAGNLLFTLTFLLFYVASSYAITQVRSKFTAEQVRQSTESDGKTQIREPYEELSQGFPQYRQAKPKPGVHVFFHEARTIQPEPPASSRSFEPRTFPFHHAVSRGSVPSRAPPLVSRV
jgi:hypothetical protein